MSARRGVLVLAPEDEGDLVRAIDARAEELRVVRRCADLAEVRAAARARVGDLVVLDSSEPDLDALVVEEIRRCGAGVVLLVDALGSSEARGLGADALAARGAPDQVVECLLALVNGPRATPLDTVEATPGPHSSARRENPAEQDPRRDPPSDAVGGDADIPALDAGGGRGRIIAVWGTSGAPGRSTIALGLAHALAQCAPTLLVDADVRDPSIAHMAGIPVDASGLSALARRSVRGALDADAVVAAAFDYSPELRLLTGLTSPHRWREIGPAALASVLDRARERCTWIVVDVAAVSLDAVADDIRQQGGRDDTTAAALRIADDILCVARADVLGINRLAHALEWWEANGTGTAPRVVVNRVDSASTGPRPRNALDAALSAIIPGSRVHLVPEDEAVAKALLKGRSVLAASSSAPASRAIAALAETFTGITAPAPGRRRRGRGVEH